MKAISLWRPWAWAFFKAGKRIENRSWPPPKSIMGEVVAIHAAKKWDREAWARMRAGEFGEDARLVPEENRHPTGIVGSFRVVGAYELAADPGRQSGPWAFGPWCWVVEDVVRLSRPLTPYRGRQGLWVVEPIVQAVIERERAA